MSKIGVAICGSSGINYITDNPKMEVFRSKIQINSVEYIDYIDISNDEFYFLLKGAKELHTAQISPGELIDLINKEKDKGITDLIMISMPSGFSGTFQTLQFVAKEVKGINIYPFDSKYIGFPEAYQGLIAVEMIEKGYQVQEILDKLTYIQENSLLAFTVETLEYLKLNGRLSNAAAIIGGLLKIKPLMYVENGIVVIKEKIRTKVKAVKKLVEDFLIKVKDKDVIPFLLYSNNYEEVFKLRKQLAEINDKFKDIPIFNVPPVIGVHAGPGAIGLGFVPKIELKKQ